MCGPTWDGGRRGEVNYLITGNRREDRNNGWRREADETRLGKRQILE